MTSSTRTAFETLQFELLYKAVKPDLFEMMLVKEESLNEVKELPKHGCTDFDLNRYVLDESFHTFYFYSESRRNSEPLHAKISISTKTRKIDPSTQLCFWLKEKGKSWTKESQVTNPIFASVLNGSSLTITADSKLHLKVNNIEIISGSYFNPFEVSTFVPNSKLGRNPFRPKKTKPIKTQEKKERINEWRLEVIKMGLKPDPDPIEPDKK